MALIDTYRSALQRKRYDLAKLSADRAKIQKKWADCALKAQKASEAGSRSKSTSTVRQKLREAARHERNASQEAEKLAKLDSKIAAKHKEIGVAQRNVEKEEKNQEAKRQKNFQSHRKSQERHMREVSTTLSQHDQLHTYARTELERMKRLPEKIIVAFFAANPTDQDPLRLDEEVRAIQEMLRKSEHRDSVLLKSFWAVRPLDVLQALNESQPAIVHFSGHGSQEDQVVLQDGAGRTKFISKEAIVQTMVASNGDIRLIFFNTCYSRRQAEQVVQHVEAAIGMGDSISDEAARVFSSQFYSAVGFGLSVAKAFEQAKAALMLEGISEEETPELFVQEGIDPDVLIIVRPEEVA